MCVLLFRPSSPTQNHHKLLCQPEEMSMGTLSHRIVSANDNLTHFSSKSLYHGHSSSSSTMMQLQARYIAPGLSLAPKLKYEHVYLTSFSKMRVDLAAQVHIVTYSNDHNDILHEQVLSSTVAKALTLRFGSSSAATAQFIHSVDGFILRLSECGQLHKWTKPPKTFPASIHITQ